MKSGFTLLEVLASLALLSVTIIGLAEWTSLIHSTQSLVERRAWSSFSDQVAMQLLRDLRLGDYPTSQDRVASTENGIRIRGRRSDVEYRFEHASGDLFRSGSDIPLLGALDRVEFRVQDDAKILTIEFLSTTGIRQEYDLRW